MLQVKDLQLTGADRYATELATYWPHKPTKEAKRTHFVLVQLWKKSHFHMTWETMSDNRAILQRPTISPGPIWPVIATHLQELA